MFIRQTIYWTALFLALQFSVFASAQTPPNTIDVDVHAAGKPFPHFWETMFGSGRAQLVLRAAYQNDLHAMKQATSIGYVRFHGIFNDEVGVYSEDEAGKPVYNFTYVDQIYDALWKEGVRPVVELSFMPKKLAANPILHPFWYKPSPSPPKDYDRWVKLVSEFTHHLVERYGEDEVARWYFEVWNEPNIDFWAGKPKMETYFRLYDSTVRAVKGVSPRLRVGGPSTAQAQWIPQFIQHAVSARVPLDFVTTHVYGSDPREGVFGENRVVPQNKMVCVAVQKTHEEVKSSARPDLPVFYTEYNFGGPQENTYYMGAYLANVIHDCDGYVDQMSFWMFSDVFEEDGVARDPFYNQGGTIAQDSIPKSSFYAFRALHRLGDERLPAENTPILVTRRKDGAIVLAVWNLPAEPNDGGVPREFTFRFKGLHAGAKASISRVDSDHGNTYGAWEKMGKPKYLSAAQQAVLRQADPGAPENVPVGSELKVTVPHIGLAVIEVK